MNELRRVLVFLFVAVLMFYMIKLFYFTKGKWKFKKHIFIILIGGIGLVFIAALLDMFSSIINNDLVYSGIKILFAAGGIIYIIGVILWTNFTKEMMNNLERLTLIDSMTGIFNRSGIEKIYESVAKSNENFHVLVCDLDGTKKINDTYGHIEGDKYINVTTRIIINVIGLKGYLARIGGDEFVILLNHVGKQELESIIIAIKKQVAEIYNVENTGISIGKALFPQEGKTLSELIKVADEKMYEDKKKLNNKMLF